MMTKTYDFVKNLLYSQLNLSGYSVRNLVLGLVVVICGFILASTIKKLSCKMMEKTRDSVSGDIKRAAAVQRVVRIVMLCIVVLAVLFAMQINGIKVGSIIASLGVIGTLAGFAAQDIFKDYIQGFNIISKKFYSIGDCIRYNGKDYQVTDFELRTTSLRDIDYGDTMVVCNRNMTEITRLSGLVVVSVDLPYSVDSNIVDELMKSCADEIGKISGVENCSYGGLASFDESSIAYKIFFYCKPTVRGAKKRGALRIIRNKLVDYNMEIPFRQVDVHMK